MGRSSHATRRWFVPSVCRGCHHFTVPPDYYKVLCQWVCLPGRLVDIAIVLLQINNPTLCLSLTCRSAVGDGWHKLRHIYLADWSITDHSSGYANHLHQVRMILKSHLRSYLWWVSSIVVCSSLAWRFWYQGVQKLPQSTMELKWLWHQKIKVWNL